MMSSTHFRDYDREEVVEKAAKCDIQAPISALQFIVNHIRNGRVGDNSVKDTKEMIMLDVGCGSGSSTRIFAPYFKSIIGCDPSALQIKKAKCIGHADNISYVVAGGESMPSIENESIDVITSLFAAHFMDMKKFVGECERVLKPNGSAFVYGYSYHDVACFDENGDLNRDPEAVKILQHFIDEAKLFFDVHYIEQSYVEERYQPQYDQIPDSVKKSRIDDISEDLHIPMCELREYFRPPGYKLYRQTMVKEKGYDPLDELMENLKKVWKVESKKEEEVKISLTLLMFIILISKTP